MSKDLPKVKILLRAHAKGEVLIDGQKVPGVVEAVVFRAAIGEVNRVTITLSASEVEIDAPAEVEIGRAEAAPSSPRPG